ncbi:carbon-nitrogen hydrolase family protein [Kordia sp. YSTF-M3]|uniref:Carbon-nitrogen hydrolase family protein n=1 Tax=Kordia aestuariivivens TaxID=2759037 RepID=A0ABR7QAR4_9FLAO|nr:carbon-nitrogen hydrolase family protein [Kordia aestuariivivens]MBC8755483.1 carbon-nitrogen hydrolase family protein [Kordia aestuariivivens]
MSSSHELKVALAQIAPVWLDKSKTLTKIKQQILDASQENCELIVFGEALLPGYPFWISYTNGAEFDSITQKEIHSHYVQNSVQVEKGDLDKICNLAKQHNIAIYLGLMERAVDRGGHSIYCSLAYINQEGSIESMHRKLMPTYEERLTWASGDGNGLRVHPLKDFTVGGLNCWENWMPLPRAALYGMGENLHIAVWPGSEVNTKDITRFIARESRSYVISVSSLMRKEDIPANVPHLEKILQNVPDELANGGSCIASPDGEWLVSPVLHKEGLIIATLDFNKVLEERQNFDAVGHYSRPDVTQLTVNRERQSTIRIKD